MTRLRNLPGGLVRLATGALLPAADPAALAVDALRSPADSWTVVRAALRGLVAVLPARLATTCRREDPGVRET